MDTAALLFPFSFFLLIFTLSRTGFSAANTCQPSSCPRGPEIRFPFRLNSDAARCGYPGFNLSCSSRQTFLNLPFSGKFSVERIDYGAQTISIIDPGNCLPRRILNFNLSGTPFLGVESRTFSFYNCTSLANHSFYYFPFLCLSNRDYTVIATPAGSYEPPARSCQRIATVTVPVHYFTLQYGSSVYMHEGLLLTWKQPNCGACEAAGGSCGYRGDTMDIACSKPPSRGLPRSAKYGVIVGVGVPGLVFLIGLVCCSFSRIKAFSHRRQSDLNLSNLEIGPPPTVTATGLDKPTIESFPKTILGESGRLPKPNDGTCPICLSEYRPKDTLRIIPECNHYFHASCVDEWLKMNGTCPLCRNSPDGSSVVTPSSSMSLSSSSSLSRLDQHSDNNVP